MRSPTASASFHAGRRSARRLRNLEILQQLSESLAVFGQIDRLRRCADNGHAGRAQTLRQVQRRLPAELHDHADLRARLRLVVVDRQHVFKHQRLEVEPVAGVVVGRDGLRIAVDHDGFVAVILQRERRMAAAVIELDSLPDAVRPRSENDDLGLVGRRRLVLFVIGRIEIRRHRFEFGGAGIHQFEDRLDAFAPRAVPSPASRRRGPSASTRWRCARRSGRSA